MDADAFDPKKEKPKPPPGALLSETEKQEWKDRLKTHKFYKPYADKINKAMDDAPKPGGTVYRGLKLTSENIGEFTKVGKRDQV